MPATQSIVTDTFITGADQSLALANADWVREFSWGSNWNRIRLGIHASVTSNGTSNITGVTHAFGVCNGTDKPFGSTPDNWVGWRNPRTGTGTLAYVANSGNPYHNFSTDRGRMDSIQSGASISATNLATAGTCLFKARATLKRVMYYLDIIRGSPTYTLILSSAEGTTTAQWDFPPWRFGRDMTAASGTVDASIVTATSGSLTVTANESTGILDCMNVYWNEPTYPLIIHALAAVRLY